MPPIADCDPDLWADVYRVNVLGANLAAAASLAHMGRDGICAFVSSRTVEDANPMFGAYSASKAALDQCIRVWRLEHPDRRFIRIVMGNTAPTDFDTCTTTRSPGPTPNSERTVTIRAASSSISPNVVLRPSESTRKSRSSAAAYPARSSV